MSSSPTSDYTTEELLKHSVQKLKKKCKSLRISMEGGKLDMIHRIIKEKSPSINEETPQMTQEQYEKVKVGARASIYSVSKNTWSHGTIQEIKDDKLCILYSNGKKMKWLKKDSPNFRVKIEISENEEKHELSGINLLKAMYKEHEYEIQQRKSSAVSDSSQHQKMCNKLEIGARASIYSASKKIWTHGTIKEIKDDTLCILYNNGKKMKWLNKDSPNFRLKQEMNDNEKQISISHQQSIDEVPPAFSVISLDVPSPPILSSNNNNNPTPSLSSSIPSLSPLPINDNVYEYDVTFITSSIGLSLSAFKDGKNCIVRQCLSSFAQKKVDPGSMICGVNGQSVLNLSYDKILAFIKQNISRPPLRLTFRSKIDGNKYKQINNVNERGLLKIEVVAGMQLKHAAKYCLVSVGNTYLTTKHLNKANHHPEWNEMLNFNNFRCDRGKTATIKVFNTSTISNDKLIGEVTYLLPITFQIIQNDSLEIRNSKNKICGCIILNTIIVKK